MKENKNNKQKNNIKSNIISAILTIVIVLISFACGYMIRGNSNEQERGLTNQVIDIINNSSYIIDSETGEPRKFTEKDYVDAIANGILDEYSCYYTPEEYKQLSSRRDGNYSGLGFELYSNTTKIFKVIGNSPADLAGMKSGEILVGANVVGKERVDFSTNEQVSQFFTQNKQEKDFVLYLQNGGQFTLSKTEFEVSYVSYWDNQTQLVFRAGADNTLHEQVSSSNNMSVLDDKTGYIKLDLFEGNASKQFGKALDFMLDNGKTKLVLDLRDNGGGSVDVLLNIASYLVYNNGQKSSVIMRTNERTGSKAYSTSLNNYDQRLEKIVVLANQYTASASECLIGAMLHYGDSFDKDLANLVIEKNSAGIAKTYGKGIMQSTYLLNNGGAFKLTTGRVLWPDSQTCIQGTGIVVTGENAVQKASALQRAVQILNN